MAKAMLRRLFLGALLPQEYQVLVNGQPAAIFRQRFQLFRYEMDLDFTPVGGASLDRRLGLAAAILLAIIEGRQRS
jgi:hypothetical protein